MVRITVCDQIFLSLGGSITLRVCENVNFLHVFNKIIFHGCRVTYRNESNTSCLCVLVKAAASVGQRSSRLTL